MQESQPCVVDLIRSKFPLNLVQSGEEAVATNCRPFRRKAVSAQSLKRSLGFFQPSKFLRARPSPEAPGLAIADAAKAQERIERSIEDLARFLPDYTEPERYSISKLDSWGKKALARALPFFSPPVPSGCVSHNRLGLSAVDAERKKSLNKRRRRRA